MTITIKDPEGIAGMRIAGRLTAELLDYLAPFVKPGVTTNELDRLAEDYTTSICTSINHQVCHGIPNDKPLKKGDIVNVDVTVIKDGWHGDSSRMYMVGEVSVAARRLCKLTYEAMWKGIMKVRPGATLGDVGHAIQQYAEGERFSVVREYCGHGIGKVY